MTDLITFTIDNKTVTVPKGTTVYTAAKELGIELPIFCYHDRMPPFGACRACLVEVDKMAKPQTSCSLVATNDMIVRTQADPAVKARQEILEFLLINHPLDCPVCDKGGECPLQDQALEFGPGKSRFFEDKRHFEKPLYLGPVLTLDRERCVTCARCTRFGDIIAGDHALELIDRGYKSEVGTADGKAPRSKFIGNTIMICPVGALTSSVYRFRARPWDNTATDSTCTLCPVGCSMTLDSRDGEIMRTRSQENRDVNDIWMCDKGWFGYEFSSSDKRLTTPLIRKSGKLEAASWEEALSYVAQKMIESKKSAAFGGNNLTIEENYLLQKLMRDLLHSNNVDHRIGSPNISLDDEGFAPGMELSIGQCETLERIVLLGIDITEEFPVIWLRIKQAINNGAKVLFLGHFAPECARYFEKTILHTPGQELEMLQNHSSNIRTFCEQSSKSAIFVGRQYLHSANPKALLSELSSYRKSVPHITINVMNAEGNSMGARFAGMHPELKPFGKKADKKGLSAIEVLQTASRTGWDFLYVVGSDPKAKFPSALWEEARSKLGCLVVQDLFLTDTAAAADVVLPTVSYLEKGGSFLNIENRVQKLKPGKAIPKGVYSDSYIFAKLAQRLKTPLAIEEAFLDALKPERLPLVHPELVQALQDTTKIAPDGLYASFTPSLFDHGVRMLHNEHLVQLAKTPCIRLHPSDAQKRAICDNDTVTVHINSKSISAKVQLDKLVANQTVVLPLGFADTLFVHELGPELTNGLAVYLQK
jgi:NADH-quinone oxidoreductase subunit G